MTIKIDDLTEEARSNMYFHVRDQARQFRNCPQGNPPWAPMAAEYLEQLAMEMWPQEMQDAYSARMRALVAAPVVHEHKWEPMPEERGRYVCACGTTGYRPSVMENGLKGTTIVAHTQKKKIKGSPTHVGRDNLGSGNARRGKRGPGEW